MRRVSRRAFLAAVGAVTGGCLGGSGTPGTSPTADAGATATATPTPTATRTPAVHPGYETTTVRARTPEGDLLGTVTAAIADTYERRYRGLSETDRLPPDRGMLFVFEEVGSHRFVMRGMEFGIDIVYADADGTITTVHHAPEPGPDEDGDDQHYPGRGQYVLEVTYGWTTDHGVEAGDVLDFSLPDWNASPTRSR